MVLGTRWLHALQISKGESSSSVRGSLVTSMTASCAIPFRKFSHCVGFKVNASIVERETDESGRIGERRLTNSLKNKAIFR